MTDTQTAQVNQVKKAFHPDIEALFDLAQDDPVLVDLGDTVAAILSDDLFAKAENAAKLLDLEIKSTRIDRGDKPAIVMVPYEEITQLLDLLDLAIERAA